MSELEDRFAEAVAAIGGVLKRHGFRKKRYVWTRVGDGIVHEIDVQRSHGNSAGSVRFYVNARAYVAEFDRAIGRAVPDDLTRVNAQFETRFEEVSDWPTDRVDVERDADALGTALPAAIEQVVAYLDGITDAPSLARTLLDNGYVLDDDLFAWHCATGRSSEAAAQFAAARERFGDEDRWPRLAALFDETAEKYGVPLP
ncbi:DUF4304 domain-containing protein [Microbacterium testaceum]|jgi:hypothetical protein|uniref:DUF4304 domain-containing protein n=1 Tax=Microbacterium testaceum TaxID=2033 RepID=A0A147F2L5_MICTE|nr:DUF4304 domain-containing protein [Microbacterium testaceum]KTS05700.1 hypothetical protein RSA3_17385 [Microbacterium testaceum]KTS81354.1 hypothetical protein NS183_17215 [Microbacterium testaceum]